MGDQWSSDSYFGFDGAAAGTQSAVAAAPKTMPTQTVGPAKNALQAITDPRGSAIFWVTAAAILSLGLVSAHGEINARLRAGKR